MDAEVTVVTRREFVTQFDAVPFPLTSHGGIGYLLLVASVNQGISAERVPDLMASLYRERSEDLLRPQRKIWLRQCRELSSAAGFIVQLDWDARKMPTAR